MESNFTKVAVGDIVVFDTLPDVSDISTGVEYEIQGSDLEYYLIDDIGDKNFCCEWDGYGQGHFRVVGK